MDKKKIAIIAGIILGLAVVTTTFVIIVSNHSDNTPTPLNTEQLIDTYNITKNNIPTDNLSYKTSTLRQIHIGSSFVEDKYEQTITIAKSEANNLVALVDETYFTGAETINSTEYYHDGLGYITTGNKTFSCPMDYQNFMQRYIPLLPIDTESYTSITGQKDNSGYIIMFKNPIRAEEWLFASDVKLINAEGQLSISPDKELKSCTYTCQYQDGLNTITVTTTTELIDFISPTPPNWDSDIISVSNIDAPKLLDKACSYLTKPINIEADYTELIYCQAFGDKRTQTIAIDVITNNNLTATIKTDIVLTTDGKTASQNELSKLEHFLDNTYKISINNSPPIADESIDKDAMTAYFQNILIGTIMLPEHIETMSITENNGISTIQFTGTPAFADQICADALSALYQDTDILNNQTETYTTETGEFYLAVDTATGLPVASGFTYIGIYTKDDLLYKLEYSTDQKYKIK